MKTTTTTATTKKKKKNAAEVDIAPASGKITKNVKYRSRAPGQGVSARDCEGHLLCKVSHLKLSLMQKKNLDVKINHEI